MCKARVSAVIVHLSIISHCTNKIILSTFHVHTFHDIFAAYSFNTMHVPNVSPPPQNPFSLLT